MTSRAIGAVMRVRLYESLIDVQARLAARRRCERDVSKKHGASNSFRRHVANHCSRECGEAEFHCMLCVNIPIIIVILIAAVASKTHRHESRCIINDRDRGCDDDLRKILVVVNTPGFACSLIIATLVSRREH